MSTPTSANLVLTLGEHTQFQTVDRRGAAPYLRGCGGDVSMAIYPDNGLSDAQALECAKRLRDASEVFVRMLEERVATNKRALDAMEARHA